MNNASNQFLDSIQFTKPIESSIYTMTVDQRNKIYYLFFENKPILLCRFENGTYTIFNLDNIKIAEISKERIFFNNRYYLYYKNKKHCQIIGIFEKKNMIDSSLYIPFIEEFNGLNTFKSYSHMVSTESSGKKRLVLERSPFIKSSKFKDSIKSAKNAKYFRFDKLVFEISENLTNSYNLFLDNPISLVQGFTLAIISTLS